MKVIFNDIEPDDFVLASRAARWLLERFQKDAIITYGEIGGAVKPKDFYVRRNKASITVRRASYDKPDTQTSVIAGEK